MADPTKQETETAFKILKSHKANKVSMIASMQGLSITGFPSCALTASREIRHGPVSHLAYIFA